MLCGPWSVGATRAPGRLGSDHPSSCQTHLVLNEFIPDSYLGPGGAAANTFDAPPSRPLEGGPSLNCRPWYPYIYIYQQERGKGKDEEEGLPPTLHTPLVTLHGPIQQGKEVGHLL